MIGISLAERGLVGRIYSIPTGLFRIINWLMFIYKNVDKIFGEYYYMN